MTVKWDVDKTIRDVKQAANQGLFLGAESVLETAISHITQDPKTGRVYRRRGIEHQASAPGEAPASDTGTLISRSTTEGSFTEHFPDELRASVVFRTAYARPLEYGTAKMAPRPYARISLEEKRKEIEQDIANRIAAALRSGNES